MDALSMEGWNCMDALNLEGGKNEFGAKARGSAKRVMLNFVWYFFVKI
jgi:hypothetical protein